MKRRALTRDEWMLRIQGLAEETGVMPDVLDRYGDENDPWKSLAALDDIARELASCAGAGFKRACRVAGLAGAMQRAAKAEQEAKP